MKPNLFSVASMAVFLALSACGGGSSSGSSSSAGSGSSGSSGGSTATAPTATQAATICSGTAAATQYDVFLPTAAGIVQSSASRYVQTFGASTANAQCISVAGSSAQGDNAPGTLQAVTADNWDQAISYFDPVNTGVNGGIRFNQQLFVTCKASSDTFLHVALANPTSASTFVASSPVATAFKDHDFQSYECVQSGSTSSPAATGTTVTFKSADGSVSIAEGTSVTTIAAADVPSLFSTAGYTLDGKVLHWYLYQLPTGAGAQQVIVHTSQRTDGTYNIDLFLSK